MGRPDRVTQKGTILDDGAAEFQGLEGRLQFLFQVFGLEGAGHEVAHGLQQGQVRVGEGKGRIVLHAQRPYGLVSHLQRHTGIGADAKFQVARRLAPDGFYGGIIDDDLSVGMGDHEGAEAFFGGIYDAGHGHVGGRGPPEHFMAEVGHTGEQSLVDTQGLPQQSQALLEELGRIRPAIPQQIGQRHKMIHGAGMGLGGFNNHCADLRECF